MEGLCSKILVFSDGTETTFGAVALPEDELLELEHMHHCRFLVPYAVRMLRLWYPGADPNVLPRVVMALAQHPSSPKRAMADLNPDEQELAKKYFEWKHTLNLSKPRLLWDHVYYTPPKNKAYLFPGRSLYRDMFEMCEEVPEHLHELAIMLYVKYREIHKRKTNSNDYVIEQFERKTVDPDVKRYRNMARAVINFRAHIVRKFVVLSVGSKSKGKCIHSMEDVMVLWNSWMKKDGKYCETLKQTSSKSYRACAYYLYCWLQKMGGSRRDIMLRDADLFDTPDYTPQQDNNRSSTAYLEMNRIPGT